MKKTVVQTTDENLSADLTFDDFPASILAKFAQKVVRPCCNGNLNAAFQDVIQKANAGSFPHKAYSFSVEA
jgi:hypothetical protein